MINLPQIANTLRTSASNIFKDVNEQKRFYNYAINIYANNEKLSYLNDQQIQACILQMFLRDADPSNGEAYIIGYKSGRTNKTFAQVQNGYKYAIKKLWQTGELEKQPIVFHLVDGELKKFEPDTRDVEYKIDPILTYQKQKERQEKKIIGWVVLFEMTNNSKIEKFFWDEEIEEHCLKYSESYKQHLSQISKGQKLDGIWANNKYAMFKKTALMRVYTLYLPKTTKINQAIQDINALNAASYDEISPHAKPVFYDNPTSQPIKPVKIKSSVSQTFPLAEITEEIEKPDLEIATKEEVKQIFELIKQFPLPEQKTLQNETLKQIRNICLKKYNFHLVRWYETPQIVCKLVIQELLKKAEKELYQKTEAEKEAIKKHREMIFVNKPTSREIPIVKQKPKNEFKTYTEKEAQELETELFSK